LRMSLAKPAGPNGEPDTDWEAGLATDYLV
jgi:hypothetical protein